MTIQTIDSASNQPIVPVSIVGANSGNGSLGVDITTAEAIVPSDIQSHLTQSITALNAVALTITGGATPTSTSAAFQTDGFNEISILSSSSVTHAGYIQLYWSFDNVSFAFVENPAGDKIVNNTNTNARVITMQVRAPYLKVLINNTDATATPTVTVNVYLKA